MTRIEFIEELKNRLTELPQEEKEDAIKYYESYFDEAGEENEEQVIRELGSPERIAKQIINDVQEEKNTGAYTETGYQATEKQKEEVSVHYERTSEEHKPEEEERKATNDGSGVTITKKGLSGNGLLLAVIVGIIGFPIWISILGVAFGLIMAAFGIVFGFGVAGVACVIAGVITLVVGIVKIAAIPIVGVVLVVVALILAGLGCLFMALSGVCVKLAVFLTRGVVKLFGRIFGGKKVVAA